MTYEGISTSGQTTNLGRPIYVKINSSEEAPADDLTAIFPFDNNLNVLHAINIYFNGNLAFYGIIDEQKIYCGPNGILLKICARSKTSLLIDNEALPQLYYAPSLKIIFDKHIKPYGFKSFIGNSKVFSSKFQVFKGMSEWNVLEEFCKYFLGVKPIPRLDGTIDASGRAASSSLFLSNTAINGIRYTQIEQNNKRYRLLSEVFVRNNKYSTYKTRVPDKESITTGISRKRYLNSVDDPRTPTVCGEMMLKAARKSSYEVNISCIGFINTEIGMKVTIDDPVLGKIENLLISKIKYILDQNGEVTELTLRKESNHVGFKSIIE